LKARGRAAPVVAIAAHALAVRPGRMAPQLRHDTVGGLLK